MSLPADWFPALPIPEALSAAHTEVLSALEATYARGDEACREAWLGLDEDQRRTLVRTCLLSEFFREGLCAHPERLVEWQESGELKAPLSPAALAQALATQLEAGNASP